MFRSYTSLIAQRMTHMIDDMLLGDFDYIEADGKIYADVDYFREHPHRFPLVSVIERRPGQRVQQCETDRQLVDVRSDCTGSPAFSARD